MKIGLFMGQSNAVGNGYGGPWRIDPKVTAWNCTTNREDTTLLGDSWVVPDRSQNPFVTAPSLLLNNQGAHAASYLARALNEDQRLIIVARNGVGIGLWHNGTSTGVLYERMLAVLSAAGVSKVDWFGWNQGSADNGSYLSYRAKWDALIAQMEADGVIDTNTPIFVSETSYETTPDINGVLNQIADDSSRVACAKIGYYETQDGVHFNGATLAMAGYEAVRAMAAKQTIFQNIVDPQAVNHTKATGYSKAGDA